MTPDVLPDDLLALALDVAREAGDLLQRGRAAGGVEAASTKSSPTDVVTVLDQASEELVGRRLREARPGDGILGEEGADEAGSSGVRWVVDPLDGTVNFLYDLPNWAVSIAAEVDGDVVAGVVHAPAMGLTYTATRGGGAFRLRSDSDDSTTGTGSAAGSVPLTGSGVTDLAGALVATGFGYTATRRQSQARVLARLLPQVRDIRRMGAASLDLCAVATGQLDAYYERGLKPWDHAAGGLVATEAGLRVAGLAGRPAGEDLLVAAPPALFGPLVELLGVAPRADTDST